MNLTFNTDADFDQIKTIVIDIIKNTANDFDLFLSTNSINNLSIHLSIAIIRIKSNNYIPLSNGQIASYKQEYSYPYAMMLCDRLAKKFELEFPEDEVSLVSMHLSKNQKLDLEVNSGFDLLDNKVFKIINEAMTLIYQEYHKDFRKDDKLLIAIGLHLEPAIERLSQGQTIENPLKDKIIERHNEEYNYSRILNNVINHETNLSFNDDELAFIALHFVVANNRINN